MADETHKLQKDPPEGSRKVIDHELERQSGGAKKGGADKAGDKPGAPQGGEEKKAAPKSGR